MSLSLSLSFCHSVHVVFVESFLETMKDAESFFGVLPKHMGLGFRGLGFGGLGFRV